MNILDRARRVSSHNPPMDETRQYGVGTRLITKDISGDPLYRTRRMELAVFVEYSVMHNSSPEMSRKAEIQANQQLMNLVYREVDEALYAARQAVMNNDLHGALACLSALEKTITYDPINCATEN